MRRDSVELALLDWVALATGAGVTAVEFAHPKEASAPRPAAPYAVVRVVQDRALSATPYAVQTTEAGADDTRKQYRSSLRQGTVRVDFYGDGAGALARKLELSIHREAVKAHFKARGVWIAGAPVVTLDTTALIGETWERRAQSDYRFRYVGADVENVPAVATVELTVNDDDPFAVSG